MGAKVASCPGGPSNLVTPLVERAKAEEMCNAIRNATQLQRTSSISGLFRRKLSFTHARQDTWVLERSDHWGVTDFFFLQPSFKPLHISFHQTLWPTLQRQNLFTMNLWRIQHVIGCDVTDLPHHLLRCSLPSLCLQRYLLWRQQTDTTFVIHLKDLKYAWHWLVVAFVSGNDHSHF